MLEFLFRLFVAPSGSGDEYALPEKGDTSQSVSQISDYVWKRRTRGTLKLLVKNYYGEHIEDWAQLRPVDEVCDFVTNIVSSGAVSFF